MIIGYTVLGLIVTWFTYRFIEGIIFFIKLIVGYDKERDEFEEC